MYFSKIGLMFISSILVCSAITPVLPANAATIPSSDLPVTVKIKEDTSAPLSDNTGNQTTVESQRLAQFVTVSNNTFFFTPSQNSSLTHEEVKSGKAMVYSANQFVVATHAVINPRTLEINGLWLTDRSKFTMKAFVWGMRFYMHGVSQIVSLTRTLGSHQTQLAGLGILGGLVGNGVVASVFGSTSLYFGNMISSINNMHTLHPKSNLYMDVNWAAIFSVHVLS